MSFPDLISTFQWWASFLLIGIIFIPATNLIFKNFIDRGYIFSKILGIALISYTAFILGFLKILPFETQNIFLIAGIFFLINLLILKNNPLSRINFKSMLPIFVLEESIFILILLIWSGIHAHQPDIHGLEKYMDYGFINSILRAKYFPPLDMWLTPFYINYYYFGHLITAVLTKISFLPSNITFNLMLSTITALSFTSAFSIGANLLLKLNAKRYTLYAGGLITASILNFAGNLHVLYLFFKPYENDNPVPFWKLIFSFNTFPNSYWYPNATRFIHNTIHEFPIYSSVVSDLHGHFLDVPLVLLTIAVLLSLLFKSKLEIINWKLEIPLISFLLGAMYMTNVWDGIIYFLLTILIVNYLIFKNNNLRTNNLSKIKILGLYTLIIGLCFIIFTIPFNINFKPFASGIGILCAPKFLTDIGKFGPLLFEADHCQRSPLWQLGTLYGFFYFWIISFIVFLKSNAKRYILNVSDIFVGILILLSTLLIIIPEFIYIKDIYPAHYRANTMFKLVYESFIMLSLSSGYIIIRIFLNHKSSITNRPYWKFAYWPIGLIVILIVFLYPYFAINSYFGDLKSYSGLNGISYLKPLYPEDYEAILWINKNIKGQPVVLEAQGDSYTDYARVSANTGLPTVLGWTVHEWLWRGTYDIPAPRITEVQKMYESTNIEETKNLLKKYKVSLVFVGNLEKQKYSNLNEEKFRSLGKIIHQKGSAKIFKLN
ncbi:MAG: DUF2298 domain-containing protein [Candidatus Parcubacteria bacterium]|nr:DUF2298 domain-containing protein [Candidatus Parcubacteria bacterium]